MKGETNFWRDKESSLFDSGIVRFAKNSIPSFERFGLQLKSAWGTPHLSPLPASGERRISAKTIY